MAKFELAGFVRELIDNTMDAILSSHLEQERKVLEILEDLELSDDDLINKYRLLENAKEILSDDADDSEVKEFVKNYLEDHKQVVQKYLDKGIPKTVVDKGSLSIKAVISVNADEETEGEGITEEVSKEPIKEKPPLKPEKKAIPSKGALSRIRGYKDLQIKLSNKVMESKKLPTRNLGNLPRLYIRPVKENEPIDERFEIVSEINIEFKTVIE